jgi:hypothetical protein
MLTDYVAHSSSVTGEQWMAFQTVLGTGRPTKVSLGGVGGRDGGRTVRAHRLGQGPLISWEKDDSAGEGDTARQTGWSVRQSDRAAELSDWPAEHSG